MPIIKLLFTALITASLFSCSNSSTNTDSPTGVVNAFIESSKKGDIEGIKKCLTQQDVQMIDMGQEIMGRLDSAQANRIKEKTAEDFKKNTKDAEIQVGNEKINGDNATVEVSTIRDGKKEAKPLSLKKENGQWKISLLSTGMKSLGMTQNIVDTNMKKFINGMKDMKDLSESLTKSLKQLKNTNTDSLKKLLDKETGSLEKLSEIEKAPQK